MVSVLMVSDPVSCGLYDLTLLGQGDYREQLVSSVETNLSYGYTPTHTDMQWKKP